MSKKNQITYVKPAEPTFLKKFKEDVGFKEGPTVETKKQQFLGPSESSDDDSDREDELPQVVVLEKDDLTAEEAMKVKKRLREKQLGELSKKVTEDAPEDGRIMFKKPAKRTSEDKFSGLTATSSKKKKEERKSSMSGTGIRPEAVKNSSLLSFGDDEEED